MEITDNETFAVAPIACICRGHVVCKATGFFYKHEYRIYFITNRHVVIDEEEGYYPERLDLKLHKDPNNLRDNRIYKMPLYDDEKNTLWLEHPKNSGCNHAEIIDVVAILLDGNISEYFIKPFSSSDLMPDQTMDLNVSEDMFLTPPPVQINIVPKSEILKFGDIALVIGYPLGYSDTIHNLPIARNATIASLNSVPFMRRPKILIDSHLHKGTSGSPVITQPIEHKGPKSYLSMMNDKKYLIGIHSGEFDADNPELGLYNVWLAKLIPDIITQSSDYFDSLGCKLGDG